MNYVDWLKTVPVVITSDSLWKMEAYRLALFAADLSWYEVTKLCGDKRTTSLADQLFRSVGSISGNIEEGYSRGTGKDRARFYEYGFGSAREARGWYYKGRYVLGSNVALHRMNLLTQVIRLLPQQRAVVVHEDEVEYRTGEENNHFRVENLEPLLTGCPMP